NLSQNVVHSDSDLILHNSSVLIDKEPFLFVSLNYTNGEHKKLRTITVRSLNDKIKIVIVLSQSHLLGFHLLFL
ncbi:hypothetical protein DVW46_06910, partial [Enterococcus faecium]